MRVEITTKQELLSEIRAGECFMRGEELFMKTTEADPDGDIQVVNMKSGEIHRYPPDNMVEPKNMKLTEA